MDAVIAEGTESGGHVGEMTTMALVPQVVDGVSIPVVAAGGIASGRQMLAAYALGCLRRPGGYLPAGIGGMPRYIRTTSRQCWMLRTAIPLSPDASAALRYGCSRTAWHGNMSVRSGPGATKEELEVYTLGSLRKAVFDGNVKEGSLMAGQVAGQLHEIRPAAVILEEMYTSFCQLKKDLAKDCD